MIFSINQPKWQKDMKSQKNSKFPAGKLAI